MGDHTEGQPKEGNSAHDASELPETSGGRRSAGESAFVQLQNAREEERLSLEDVAESLGIRALYLEHIEQGRLDALPGRAYAAHMLTAYASHVGLDPGEVLQRAQLDRYFAPRRRGERVAEGRRRKSRSRSPAAKRRAVALVVLVVLFAVFVLVLAKVMGLW